MRLSHSKADATGRSSGKVPGRKGKNIRPPKGKPWVWHTGELLVSPAWRAQSINCRRLLDCLEVDHMNHAGTENGKLMATHDQLREWGIGGRHIRPAIEEAEFLGFITVQRGGRWGCTNTPSTFRLTYLPCRDNFPPSNDWERRTKEEIAAWKAERRLQNQRKRDRPKKQIPASLRCNTTAHLRAVPEEISEGSSF